MRYQPVHDDEYIADKRPICQHCNSDRVMWLKRAGKWSLCDIEEGDPHRCDPTSRELDSFDTKTKA